MTPQQLATTNFDSLAYDACFVNKKSLPDFPREVYKIQKWSWKIHRRYAILLSNGLPRRKERFMPPNAMICNLYNYYCVKTIGLNDMGPWTTNINIMCSWEELVAQQWVAMYEAGQLREFALGNLKYVYYFEPGMTFVDWASSPYNIDGWIFIDDHVGGLRHPETSEMVSIGYDKNGNRYLLEHKVGYPIKSVAEAKEWGYNP